MSECHVTSLCNQKGGVAKTSVTVNLGVGLQMAGKRVLIVDTDPQGNASLSLGVKRPDDLEVTVTDIMNDVLEDVPFKKDKGILKLERGISLLPANIELAGMESILLNAMSRETILKTYLDKQRPYFDEILIDCMPSLGMMPINALAACDSVLIPSQPQFLSTKGLEQLLRTIGKAKRQLNPKMRIDGVLLTMVDRRTIFTRELVDLIREQYGNQLRVFKTEIPHSIRAVEATAEGKSIFQHDPTGKVALAYEELTKEVLQLEKQREKHRTNAIR